MQDLPEEQEESLLRFFTPEVVASIKARKTEQAQVRQVHRFAFSVPAQPS